MHAMWKPQKFKYIYLIATLYVFTLTIPSASAVYWAFGDQLLNHSNAFSLLPKDGWRDAAVILMLIHQFITFGFACTPLYFVWEKVIGMHDTKSICLRALVRLPVVIPIWFLAIIFPFFGPINSAVGALLVSFTVYIIPALAHMLTYRNASARQVMHLFLYLSIIYSLYCIIWLSDLSITIIFYNNFHYNNSVELIFYVMCDIILLYQPKTIWMSDIFNLL